MAALKPYTAQYKAAALPSFALIGAIHRPPYGQTTTVATVGVSGESAVVVRVGKCARIIAWQIPALPPP